MSILSLQYRRSALQLFTLDSTFRISGGEFESQPVCSYFYCIQRQFTFLAHCSYSDEIGVTSRLPWCLRAPTTSCALAVCVCMFFTFNRFFYPSSFSTPSVSA